MPHKEVNILLTKTSLKVEWSIFNIFSRKKQKNKPGKIMLINEIIVTVLYLP